MTFKNGIVELDSEAGNRLGFTADKFTIESYLWINGDTLTVSFIATRNRGNFRALIQRARLCGFTIVIPTPLGRMQSIVRKNGYVQAWSGKGVELWTLEKPV